MARFTCNFISTTFTRAVDITVILPTMTMGGSMPVDGKKPSHAVKEKYPVLYLLHGGGNNHMTWAGYTNIELFAEERNIAVVMLSGDNRFYANFGSGSNYFDFIADELPDFVGSIFPVSTKPEDSYIAGLSMGGFGTFIHGFSNPERYAAMGAFSAATEIMKSELASMLCPPIDEKYEPIVLARKLAAGGKKFPKIYMSCGEKDFLYDANVNFRDELKTLGADVTWTQNPSYGHEWRFWNEQVEAFLDWLPRTDYYGLQGKRSI